MISAATRAAVCRKTAGDTGGMNGSSDVMLQYSDDSADSYPNIFDNAKTDPDDGDKSRLINSSQKSVRADRP